MAEEPFAEGREDAPSGEPESQPRGERSRRIRITPEQRRFLGPGRSLHDQQPSAQSPEQAAPSFEKEEAATRPLPLEEDDRPRPVQKARLWKPDRAVEMQTVALVASGLIVLVAAFFLGRKFDSWRYALLSQKQTKALAAQANKFPNVSAEELVSQGLVAENLNNWSDAAEHYIAAKFKNLSYSGLLFRAGKLYYDHSAFDDADTLFDRAIAFGENVDASNYYRGMIALGREDFPAAERFFESACDAAPFNADYYYSWAETLRKDQKPKEAIARYQDAAARATEQQALICRFKTRMAMVEAGELDSLQSEIEKRRRDGTLTVDWLMTVAAIQIRGGEIEAAVQTVEQARASDQSHLLGLFAACAGDRLFTSACRNHPELARACQVSATPTQQPSP